MADLVVGLSKTAVQLLADKVKSAIKEEAEQWKIVQRDLVFITGEFEMMQSFLDTAGQEHVKNKIVRTWVRQVRDLSNDVEDNIDFVLHLDTTKRSWWLRLLPSCGRAGATLPVDEAVAETTLLRARVVDVSQRNIRYNLIVDSASKPRPAATDQVQETAGSSFEVLINAIKTSGPLDLAGLITREDTDLHVVSVCGTEGDFGKVVLVRKAYSDTRVSDIFKFRAWVKLIHPFNPHKFIKSLMAQFLTHSCQEQEDVIVGLDTLERMQQATQGGLIKDFAQKVNTHRYLIILEDLCTMVDWDAIRSYLPDRKKGSRIVVLTHHLEVASQCTGEPCQVSELGQFPLCHSVCVYYKEGFQHDRVQSFIKPEPHHSLSNLDLLGRDTEMDELLKKIQDNRLTFVWGMPGVGKSALVKAIYNGKLRTFDQFMSHAWVCVSHPFNPTDFCRSLLVSLHTESTSLERNYAEAFLVEDPIKVCQDHLSKCVCLLVIDGVQSIKDWDWIKSNLMQYGSSKNCTITITSEESVAKHCAVSIDGVYNIKCLDATAAIKLFDQVVEMSSGKRWYQNLEGWQWDAKQEGKLFLAKCGGLPRVLTTAARYLASKPSDLLQQEIRRLSDNFMHELATNPEFDSLRLLLALMHSYLQDACPRYLKKYMLYLSVFPQDIIIRRRRLIRRWIAEGYSKGTDSNSTDKYAEKIFDEVAALSIMQPVLEASKVIGYRVNGFFREYVLSRPVEERACFPVEVSALETHGQSRLTIEGIGQHLALWGSWLPYQDDINFESLDMSRLRSLTIFNGSFWSFQLSDMMRVLRVLDLENANFATDHVFEEIGKLPSRLKFLSLRGQSGISRLPKSVGDLLQLQTLDIRGTCIVTLPPFITKLRKLQYIRAGTPVAWTDDVEGSSPSISRSRLSCLPEFLRCEPVRHKDVVVPRGIKRLKALQTLGAIFLNTVDGHHILDEILSLHRLKKLEVSGLNQKHGLARLSRFNHLESLSLQFEKNSRWAQIYFPDSLRSLKMYGCVDNLPDILPNLLKLSLEMTRLFTAPVINELGSIPTLRTLRLRVNEGQDGDLNFAAGLFCRLQVLEIACKSMLHLRFYEGTMEKLELLKVHALEGTQMRVSGLEHPVSLKQVWLLGSFDYTRLEVALQRQLHAHPQKPALKVRRDRH